MTGSVQLRRYLYERAAHRGVEESAALSGLLLAEARLTEKARDRGELADIEPLAPTHPAAGIAAEARSQTMAKKAKPNEGVTNLSETKELIRTGVPEIINLKTKRAALNEQISSIRKNIAAAGVPVKALDHAIRVREMDPKDREAFDEGYAIARDAIGVPQSRSLFDMLDTPAGQDDGDEEGEPAGNGADAALAAAKTHLAGAKPAPDAVTH